MPSRATPPIRAGLRRIDPARPREHPAAQRLRRRPSCDYRRGRHDGRSRACEIHAEGISAGTSRCFAARSETGFRSAIRPSASISWKACAAPAWSSRGQEVQIRWVRKTGISISGQINAISAEAEVQSPTGRTCLRSVQLNGLRKQPRSCPIACKPNYQRKSGQMPKQHPASSDMPSVVVSCNYRCDPSAWIMMPTLKKICVRR